LEKELSIIRNGSHELWIRIIVYCGEYLLGEVIKQEKVFQISL